MASVLVCQLLLVTERRWLEAIDRRVRVESSGLACSAARCVTSVLHGVGDEQRGQIVADSGMSVAQEGQRGTAED